ncbi:MAG: hypothetical protein IBX43_01430 [Campylobacterales bacterium]|nr:hypothetical protein [Campylobacterales bacterium]
MLSAELFWDKNSWHTPENTPIEAQAVQLILLFADVSALEDSEALDALALAYPKAQIVGASTAGTIESASVHTTTRREPVLR